MLSLPSNLECYRRRHPSGETGDGGNFMLVIPARGLAIIGSNGGGWEHVSVSTRMRCPTWQELEWVKRQLWSAEDCVMQLHVPVAAHVNCHPHTLHLWRPLETSIPMPPSFMVG